MLNAATRRKALSEQTRGDILAAARESFGALGYEAASIGVIAKAAGVTSGALYHHFADKQALFAAVAEKIEADLMAELAQIDGGADEGAADPWAQLEAAALYALDHLMDDRLRRIVLVDAPKVLGAPAWRAIQMRYGLGMATAAMTAMAQAGLARTADPALAAQMLLAALFQGAEAAALDPDPKAALARVRQDLLTLMRAYRA